MNEIINERESSDFVMPQPEDITRREREDAMGSYLMMFGAWAVGLPLPFINLIAGLIYHLVNHKKSRFVGFNSFQSLMSQIPVTILNSGVIIFFIYLLIQSGGGNINYNDLFIYFLSYLVFTAIINIVYLVYSIIAAVRSYQGRFFYMLLFGSWAFHIYYLKEEKKKNTAVNRPPGAY